MELKRHWLDEIKERKKQEEEEEQEGEDELEEEKHRVRRRSKGGEERRRNTQRQPRVINFPGSKTSILLFLSPFPAIGRPTR